MATAQPALSGGCVYRRVVRRFSGSDVDGFEMLLLDSRGFLLPICLVALIVETRFIHRIRRMAGDAVNKFTADLS